MEKHEFEWVKSFKFLFKPVVILIAFVITPILEPIVISWIKRDLEKEGLKISDLIDKKPR